MLLLITYALKSIKMLITLNLAKQFVSKRIINPDMINQISYAFYRPYIIP